MYLINYKKTKISADVAKTANIETSRVGYAVPMEIANDMVSLIPDSWFKPKDDELISEGKLNLEVYTNNHRVLDICCNSGILLERFLQRFRSALIYYAEDSFNGSEDKLCEYIIKNLLYGISASDKLCRIIRGILYNNQNVYGNIYNYNIFGNNHCMDDDEIELRGSSIYIYNKEKGDKIPMKFDVVVGNPPYNNDIYLDFVMLGHKIAKTYDLWITPAKFWAKSTCDKDTKFRNMIKDSGDSFVVYKDCKEIFDISEPGGIAYYLLKKDNINSAYKIKCIHKSSIAFQSDFEEHDNLDFLPLHTLNILNKLGKSNFKDTINLLENMYINRITPNSSGSITIMQGKKLYGYVDTDDLKTLSNLDMYKCIQNCICGSGAFQADDDGAFLGMPPVYVLKPNEIGKGSFHHLRFFNTASEATHFVEFMSTKLVNFAYICGLCGTTNSSEFYRYIPDPGSFDRIFEDKPLDGYTPDENGEYIDADENKHCSLYVKYKLTQQEIDIIESVIRERR